MTDSYNSPWNSRYSSPEMLHIFSDRYKYGLWRRLWVALAESQQALGLPITASQIAQMRAHLDDIDFMEVQRQEKRCGHDVMAHVYAFGKQCPEAQGIIHLGATSCYVTDNGDVIQYREAMRLVKEKLLKAISQLASFAHAHCTTPCLGLTHLQPAQVTTVGKRACLWLQDFVTDHNNLDVCVKEIRLLGVKGAVGTQASFLALFEGSHEKVQALEADVANRMGFSQLFTISGQTYPRKQDVAIAQVLSGIAVSAHKFATDLRLLASRGELMEPFAEEQIGSSAMPYKRNPVLSERVCALARYAINLSHNAEFTAALQWLERSLDDSANRRLTMPELFLCLDAILNLLLHITDDLKVGESAINRELAENLPFIATENILMESVRRGGDRQQLHERLRQHSFAASEAVQQGKGNDLLMRIVSDTAFGIKEEDIAQYADPTHFVGRAPEQVREFLAIEVRPLLTQPSHM